MQEADGLDVDQRVRMRLEAEVLSLASKAGNITDQAGSENRGLTDEERDEVSDLLDEMKALRSLINRSFRT